MAKDDLIRVFIDSDVIISSLISYSGAAYMLLHNTNNVNLYVSNLSSVELVKVVDRLNLDPEDLRRVIGSRLSSVKINKSLEKLQIEFADYVRDPDDAHIVAGAKEAKASFLVSYNVRDFKADKLKKDFQIILSTPGLLLQHIRNLRP